MPSPLTHTPLPPSTTPISFWDLIENYPTNYTTPPPIQENPPHPYLEGNLCINNSAAKLLKLPPSDITDNNPPITPLWPPMWDQHKPTPTPTKTTFTNDTSRLSTVATEKR